MKIRGRWFLWAGFSIIILVVSATALRRYRVKFDCYGGRIWVYATQKSPIRVHTFVLSTRGLGHWVDDKPDSLRLRDALHAQNPTNMVPGALISYTNTQGKVITGKLVSTGMFVNNSTNKMTVIEEQPPSYQEDRLALPPRPPKPTAAMLAGRNRVPPTNTLPTLP
jgi:hypothetical protein